MSESAKPRLRWPLDVQYIVQEGRDFAVLRDPFEVAPEAALVPAPLMPIIARFDGTRSIETIVAEGASYGVSSELVRSILEQLDHFLLIDNARSQNRFDEMKAQYRALTVRDASHAGIVYPSDPIALKKEISRYRAGADKSGNRLNPGTAIIGYIAPHIDYNRGCKTYGAGYQIFEQIERPDVIFLLGTAHQPSDGGYYHLTDKGFKTPFGVVPSHQEIIQRLCHAYGTERLLRNEILHRREHSLELQLPFIANRFAAESQPPIVPILVGSFHNFLLDEREPISAPEIGDFVAILAEITKGLRQAGQRVLFYGGVDLAHVGTHFGDRVRISDGGLGAIEARDRELLDAILGADESRLFQHMAEDKDMRRICGFPSIYTMLAALRQAGISPKGQLVEYRQAVDPKLDCTVTFASAYWTVS